MEKLQRGIFNIQKLGTNRTRQTAMENWKESSRVKVGQHNQRSDIVSFPSLKNDFESLHDLGLIRNKTEYR